MQDYYILCRKYIDIKSLINFSRVCKRSKDLLDNELNIINKKKQLIGELYNKIVKCFILFPAYETDFHEGANIESLRLVTNMDVNYLENIYVTKLLQNYLHNYRNNRFYDKLIMDIVRLYEMFEESKKCVKPDKPKIFKKCKKTDKFIHYIYGHASVKLAENFIYIEKNICVNEKYDDQYTIKTVYINDIEKILLVFMFIFGNIHLSPNKIVSLGFKSAMIQVDELSKSNKNEYFNFIWEEVMMSFFKNYTEKFCKNIKPSH